MIQYIMKNILNPVPPEGSTPASAKSRSDPNLQNTSQKCVFAFGATELDNFEAKHAIFR